MDSLFFLLLLFIGINMNNSSSCKDETPACLRRLVSVAILETSTIIIYDEANDNTESVLRLIVDDNQLLLMYELQSFYTFIEHHMKNILENATSTDYRYHLNFLLICGQKSIDGLMSHVTELDNRIGQRSLLRHFSTWLIICPDPPPRLDITLDHVTLVQVSQVSQIETRIPFEVMKNQKTDSEMKQKSLTNSTQNIYTLLWMPTGREWSHVHSYDHLSFDQLFPNIQRRLNGRQLILTTLEWRPYTKRHIKNMTVSYVGAGIDVVDMYGKKFNFSYVVVEPGDMLWGQRLENGNWTGVLGMVQRAEADTCPVPYAVTLGRKKILDFTHAITASEYSALYRRRLDDKQSWLHFFSSFSWQVYICGLASLLWIVLLCVCIHKQSMSNHGPDTLVKEETMSRYFDNGIRILLRQEIRMWPDVTAVKIVTVTWCIICVVMTAVYTGNLVAFATVNKFTPPFTTLQDLAEQDEYAVGVLEGGFAENVLMTSEDPLLKAIYRKVLRAKNAVNNSRSTENIVPDSIQRVLEEKYVLIATSSVKDIIKSLTCDVVEMREKLFPIHSSFVFPRHSPLKKLLDEQALITREIGIMSKLEAKWTPKPRNCDSPMHIPKFKLDSFKTPLLTCAACILVSAAVLLLEMLRIFTNRQF